MKALPPTLRINKRYVLCRIVPHNISADGKEIYYAVYEAISSLFGDNGAADTGMSVVHTEGNWTIIRCTRGTEKKLRAAISTVTKIADMQCAIRPVLTSGTILTLKEKIQNAKSRTVDVDFCCESANPAEESAGADCAESNLLYAKKDIIINGISYHPVRVSQEKIDLYKEGIKNQDSLYYTIKDIEEL